MVRFAPLFYLLGSGIVLDLTSSRHVDTRSACSSNYENAEDAICIPHDPVGNSLLQNGRTYHEKLMPPADGLHGSTQIASPVSGYLAGSSPQEATGAPPSMPNGGWTPVDYGELVSAHTSNGKDMVVWASNCMISDSIRNSGVWEPSKSSFLGELLDVVQRAQTQPRFLDVGANIGYFSVLAASHNATVTAIEAMEPNAYALSQSIQMNTPALNIQVVHQAVNDKPDGRACIEPTNLDVNRGNGRIGSRSGQNSDPCANCRYCPSYTTLDTLVATAWGKEHMAATSVLKVDIEGHETRMLLGGATFLSDPGTKPCVILAEHIRGNSGDLGDTRICEELDRLDYTIAHETAHVADVGSSKRVECPHRAEDPRGCSPNPTMNFVAFWRSPVEMRGECRAILEAFGVQQGAPRATCAD